MVNWIGQQVSNGGLGPGHDESSWWLIGNGGATLRDMYYPECFHHPGSKSSPFFSCSETDFGGVHTNNGVVNRLFAVMVQGGFDDVGVSLPALGWPKALSLMWYIP